MLFLLQGLRVSKCLRTLCLTYVDHSWFKGAWMHTGATELCRQDRQMTTQLLVLAVEPYSKSIESSLVALVSSIRDALIEVSNSAIS